MERRLHEEDKEEERKVRASLEPLKVKLTYGTD